MSAAPRRAALAPIAALASACLSVPTAAPSDGGATGTIDAAPGASDGGAPDATPDATTGCRRELAIDMTSASEMTTWSIDDGDTCNIANNGTLVISHEDGPSLCRRYQLDTFDLVDNAIRVTMSPSVGALHMSFAVVLPGETPEDLVDARPVLFLEREETNIQFRSCAGGSCSTLGKLVYDQVEHATWQLSHDSTTGIVRASAIGDDGIERSVGLLEVAEADLRCVGLLLGSFEGTSTALEVASFDDLIAP